MIVAATTQEADAIGGVQILRSKTCQVLAQLHFALGGSQVKWTLKANFRWYLVEEIFDRRDTDCLEHVLLILLCIVDVGH